MYLVVSENKVLCHPASVDSLTTSAGTEDHVSMGGFAARKCVTVVEHVEQGTSYLHACADDEHKPAFSYIFLVCKWLYTSC